MPSAMDCLRGGSTLPHSPWAIRSMARSNSPGEAMRNDGRGIKQAGL